MKNLKYILILLVTLNWCYGQDEAYLDSVLKVIETSKEDTSKVEALLNAGGTYQHLRDFDQAVNFNKKGLELAKKLNYRKGEAAAYTNLGLVNDNLGNYEEAIDYNIRSLRLYEELNGKRNIALCNNNIGSVYLHQENYKKAEEYYLKALAISEFEYTTMENLALLYSYTKQYDLSIKYHIMALKGYEKKNYSIGIADVNTNMALVYYDMEDYNTSLALHLKALEKYLQVGEKLRINLSYENIGGVYIRLKQFDKAEQYLKQALDIATEIGDKEGIRSCYNGLYDLYRQKGDFKLAYEQHLLYAGITDSLLNDKSTRQITEMNSKYESEKKDKELLKKDAEIEKQQTQARQQNIIIISAIAGIILAGILGLFILKSYREKQRTNIAIFEQKTEIELKNKEIIDSIEYAKRIQGALLAGDKLLNDNLKEHFVLYKPKDIVSGDFYWAHRFENKFLVCTADCTGHGVPGAFMSLLNISILNEVTTEKKIIQPDKVLNYVRDSIITTLNTEGNEESKDGMDCILCCIDLKNKKLEYAAANNSFYIIRKGELLLQSADKMPVGKSPRDTEAFTLRTVDLQEGDLIYTLTDGYADQFGGPKGKKFKYKTLEDLLITIYKLPMQEQHKILNEKIQAWKGSSEQVDDILMIGIRI